jgi:hypothetical protein
MWLAAGCTRALASPPEKRKSVVEKGGERLSRGMIDQTLETLDTPENRARLGRILNSPEMREAVHDLSASLVLGMADGMQAAMQTHGTSMEGVGPAVGEAMDRHVTPAVARLAHRVIGSAIDASLTDERMGRLELLGEHSTHAVVRGFSNGIEQDLGPALALTLEKDVGPALARVIEHDLMPAVARSFDTPEMQRAVANLSRSIASQFVQGAGDAISDTSQGEGKLTLFGNKVALGYAIALFLAFALGTLSIVLIVVLIRNSRRLRKTSADAAERETALMNIIDNLETENPELKADLRRLLQGELQEKS